MVEDSPGKTLFFFALPMILGNLFQQFYNMADSVIVGRYVGEEALAAVGASYALTTVFVMLAIGGGTGSSVITSQYLGAERYNKMKTSISTTLLVFLGVSIVLALFGLLCSESILSMLKTPDNILDDAGIYLKIYFCGLPFLFMYNVLAAMFHAMGDSKTPLYLLIFSSVLNVVLDIFSVAKLGMGVAGVAAATVVAQGISAVISFGLLLRRLKAYETDGRDAFRRFDKAMLGRMILVAIPTMLQQSIVSIGMLLVQSVVNGFGSSVLAGYTAATRIDSICIVPMIATGNAVSTFTAQNMGAGKPERVKQGYRAARFLVYGFAVLICVILLLLKNQMVGIFMDDGANAAAYSTGVSYLSFMAFFFVGIGLKATTDGILRGSGDMVVFTVSNLVNLGIRVIVANLCAPLWGVAAVWYAVPMGWTANYLISLIRYLSGKWSEKKLITTG